MGINYGLKIRMNQSDVERFRAGQIDCPVTESIKREVPRLTGNVKVETVHRNGIVDLRCIDAKMTFKIDPIGRRIQRRCQEYERHRILTRESEKADWNLAPTTFYIEM